MELIRKISDQQKLYRDNDTGIAWIVDGSTGENTCAHANIDASGSVEGMKTLGRWKQEDRILLSNGCFVNIDTLVIDESDEAQLLLRRECRCPACKERILQGILNPGVWRNDACTGYAIAAMEACGYSYDEIFRITRAMHEAYDSISIEDAAKLYQQF